MLNILLDIRKWKLVSVCWTDHRPVSLPRHRRWMAEHQHLHCFPEVMFVLRGHAAYGFRDQVFPCAPGTIFVFDPGLAHDNGYPAWTGSMTCLWTAFVEGRAMTRLVSGSRGRIRIKDNIIIRSIIDLDQGDFWRRGASAFSRDGLPAKSARLRLLAALAELVSKLVEEGYGDGSGDPRHVFQREKIELICRHIRETGGADARLDHLAQIAGYSKFHFLRLFQYHAGQSVREYVNQVRLRKVKELRGRGTAFKAIAAELGFSCPAAFSRWYSSCREKQFESGSTRNPVRSKR